MDGSPSLLYDVNTFVTSELVSPVPVPDADWPTILHFDYTSYITISVG